MIMNDFQYHLTREWVAKFEEAFAFAREHADEGDDNARAIRRIQADAFRYQMQKLQAQLAEYDALRSGQPVTVVIASIADLPRALIKARIANGLTQADLAARLEVPLEQIEQDEEHEYDAAPLSRLIETAEVLGITLGAELVLPTRAALVA